MTFRNWNCLSLCLNSYNIHSFKTLWQSPSSPPFRLSTLPSCKGLSNLIPIGIASSHLTFDCIKLKKSLIKSLLDMISSGKMSYLFLMNNLYFNFLWSYEKNKKKKKQESLNPALVTIIYWPKMSLLHQAIFIEAAIAMNTPGKLSFWFFFYIQRRNK